MRSPKKVRGAPGIPQGWATSAAVLTVNTVLVFALLNLALALALRLRRSLPARHRALDPVADRIGLDRLASAYPELSREELKSFLAEWVRVNRWEYEAFTDFRQAPVRGRYVNVSEVGYRFVRNQGPWPPPNDALNVFVLGGSTAFGHRLPDEETIPSALQEALSVPGGRRVLVYNFARPGYFSTQERILFEQLLLSGVVPGVAVFIDGLNEGLRPVERPEHPRWSSLLTERLVPLVDEANSPTLLHPALSLLRALPMTRVGLKLIAKAQTRKIEPIPSQEGVAARWRANRQMIRDAASRHGVSLLFVWQPIPVFRYDLRYHLPGGDVSRIAPFVKTYGEMERDREARPADWEDVLWLAGVQEGRRENLYVDEVHYTAKFSRELAAAIARRLMAKELKG